MSNNARGALSHEWFKALAIKSQVEIPEHILFVFEAFQDMNALAIKDYRSKSDFVYKEDDSPAGLADVAIETSLHERFQQRYPEYYFKGEEVGDNTPEFPQEGDQRIIVDPIDGTRNNLYGRDDFAISVAHQVFLNGQWETKNALLALPVKGEILWASENKGAYFLQYNPMITEQPILKEFKIAAEGKPFNRSLFDLSIKAYSSKQEAAIIEAIRDQGGTHRTIGSAAIALAYTGLKSDGAIVMAFDYDVAAGAFIAKEAGAYITQSDYKTERGEDLKLIVAGKGHVAQEALSDIVSKFPEPIQ